MKASTGSECSFMNYCLSLTDCWNEFLDMHLMATRDTVKRLKQKLYYAKKIACSLGDGPHRSIVLTVLYRANPSIIRMLRSDSYIFVT